MIIEHQNKSPNIHPSAYIAPNAVICGDVTIGENVRILFGAQVIAEKEDIILFSPACASFDQFKNYVERGQIFEQLVADINDTAINGTVINNTVEVVYDS